MDVLFDIGHYPPPGDPGAYSKELDMPEHGWCDTFGHVCQWLALTHKLFTCQIIKRKTTISELCSRINTVKPVFVISVHVNGAESPYATGTECLYYKHSERGRWAAEVLQGRMTAALGLRSRGVKPSLLPQLWMVNAPIVLIEPFFLTSTHDVKVAMANYQALVEAVVYGTLQILGYFKK
jgi:hypothetical protein